MLAREELGVPGPPGSIPGGASKIPEQICGFCRARGRAIPRLSGSGSVLTAPGNTGRHSKVALNVESGSRSRPMIISRATRTSRLISAVLLGLSTSCADMQQKFQDGVCEGLVSGTWKFKEVRGASAAVTLGSTLRTTTLVLASDNTYTMILGSDTSPGKWSCAKGSLTLQPNAANQPPMVVGLYVELWLKEKNEAATFIFTK